MIEKPTVKRMANEKETAVFIPPVIEPGSEK